jgi:hypothetical protein
MMPGTVVPSLAGTGAGHGLPVIVVFIADIRDRINQIQDREILRAPLGYWTAGRERN